MTKFLKKSDFRRLISSIDDTDTMVFFNSGNVWSIMIMKNADGTYYFSSEPINGNYLDSPMPSDDELSLEQVIMDVCDWNGLSFDGAYKNDENTGCQVKIENFGN